MFKQKSLLAYTIKLCLALAVVLQVFSFTSLLFKSEVQASSDFSFPWANGTLFRWERPTAWHGNSDPLCNGIPCAIDFSTTDSNNTAMYAMAAGTVSDVKLCQNGSANITINHNGAVIKYYHLDRYQLGSAIKQGNPVYKGQIIGKLKWGAFGAPDTMCGYTGQSHAHIHLVLTTSPITIDGWKFEYGKNFAIDANGNTKTSNGGMFTSSNTLQLPSVSCKNVAGTSSPVCPVFRFWSEPFATHFYTINSYERDYVVRNDTNWKYENEKFYAFKENDKPSAASPIYRFWSPVYQSHFYTISEVEKNNIINNNPNWNYDATAEKIYAYKVGSQPSGSTPVYRFWSPVYLSHFYTISEDEKNYIINHNPNWNYETIAFYVYQ